MNLGRDQRAYIPITTYHPALSGLFRNEQQGSCISQTYRESFAASLTGDPHQLEAAQCGLSLGTVPNRPKTAPNELGPWAGGGAYVSF